MKRKTPLLVLIVLALFLVLQSVVIVHAYEYKVVTQFGSVVSVYETPGPHLKIPFIQSTQSIPKKKMLYDLSPSDVTTKDKKVMNVDSFIIWEVTDPVRYMSALHASQEKAETRIGNVVYNSLKTVLSATSQEDIISGRDGKLAQTITSNIGSQMDPYGIRIIAVETKKLDLPDSNKESVYQRMISERNNIAASYTAEGNAEAKRIRNEADKKVMITLSEANARAAELRAEGDAEYMRILADVYDSENEAEFYTFMIALDALQQSMTGSEKTLILDADSPIAKLFY